MPTDRTRSPSDTARPSGATRSRAETPTLSRKDQSALLLLLERDGAGESVLAGLSVHIVTARRLEARGLITRPHPDGPVVRNPRLILTDAGRAVAKQLLKPLPLGGSFSPIAQE